MYTRQMYLGGGLCTHRQYYAQFVTDEVRAQRQTHMTYPQEYHAAMAYLIRNTYHIPSDKGRQLIARALRALRRIDRLLAKKEHQRMYFVMPFPERLADASIGLKFKAN